MLHTLTSKAFDNVPHGKTICKIKIDGIQGDDRLDTTLTWLLTKDTVEKCFSDWRSVNCDILQGSLILFYLGENIRTLVSKFKVDTKMAVFLIIRKVIKVFSIIQAS